STDEICINANDGSITVTPTDGTGPYAVSLNGGTFTTPPSAGPITISNLSDTTYTIDVRDANGCTYTLPAAITIAEGVDIQGDYQIFPTCTNNVIGNIVFPTVNPNIPASDFECALDGGIFEPADSTFYQDLSAGSHTITFRYINGCTQDVTFTVPALLPISASIDSQTNVLCFGNITGEITVMATGGTGTLSYAISDQTPPVFGTYQSTGVFTGLAAGDYTISIMDDNVGCETQLTTTITEPTAALTATASSTNEICINANDGTITVVPVGGTAPYETSLNGSAFASQLSYTGLADAAYTINVRDANGCTYTLPAAITIAEGVDMQPVATVTPTCVSNTPDNDVTIAINPAVAVSDVTYSIDGTNYQASNTFTGVNLGGGTYTAYAQYVNGCIQTTTFTIIDRLPVTATAAVTADVLCYGTTTGEITVTASGGTTPLEYAISTATPPVFTTYQPSNVFAGLAAGDYTISVRDAIGCEVVTTVLTVTQPTAALTATASSTNEICINANDGTITIVPVGGTAPYETSLNGSAFAAQLSYTGLADAAYTIDVRDANGCTYTLPAAITIAEGVDMQPVATVTPTCVSNTPDNDVIIAINPAVAASDVMYSIDGTNYQASNTFTGVSLAGGTYTAYAQHVNGCIQTTTFTIIDRLPVTATAAVTADVLCYGNTTGEITVTATGGTTPLEYAISTATPPVFTAYQPSNVFAGLAAGDYTISIRDAIGCEVITTVLTVTQPTAALTATATSTNEICINANDGTITIVPAGGTAPYETSLNGSAFAAQLSYTGLADAAYTIDVRDANGCTYTLPAAITIAEGVDMQPVATVTPTCVSNTPDNDITIAINQAVAASDVTYSIDGTNYQASNTFTGVSLAGGTYTAYAQHVNGCIQTTTFTIIDRLPVTATAAVTADVLCYGTTTGEITVTASGGTTPLEYAISTATPPVFTTYQPSNVFAGLAAGDYTISVRDAIGCEVVTTVLTVAQPTAALAVTVSKTDEQCLNANDGTITIVATGGTAPYQSRIDSAAAFTAQMNYTALADGIYDVEVVDANGCSYTEQITIATGIQIQPSLLVTQQCTETTIEVSVNPAVVTDVMYSLDGGTPQSSNTFVVDGLDPAVTHTITVTHIQGCSEAVDFNINPVIPIVMSAPTVTDVACHGKAVGAIQVNATGGTGPLQYAITWNIWPTPIYGPSNNFTDLLAGQYTLWVKDAMGCVVTTTVDVSEPAEALTLSAVATAESCINAHDGTITITPQGGVAPYSTAIVSAVNFQQDVLTYSSLFGGTYDVYVRDANGCYAKTTVTIEKGVNLNPYIQTTLSCDNNNPVNTVTVLLNPVVQNLEYSLTGATGSYTANNVFDIAPGSYTVYVKHINGCTAQLDFTVQDRPAVVATASSEDATCNGVNNGSITVTASGGTGTLKYGISPDFAMTQNPVFNNLLAGNYTIRVEDAYGCYTEVPVVVNEPTAIAVTVVDVLQEICVNDDNGVIEIGITGGTGPYATSLTPNGVFVEDQILFDNLDGGVTYTIYVKDTNGCTTTIDVPLDAPMDINATSQVVYNCNENTVTIVTDGNIDPTELTYTIEGPKGNNPPQTSNVFANLQDGTYTVEVLHISGCTDTTSFTIESTDELTLLLAESGLNQFKASTSGGKGPYTYTFEGNDMGTKNTFVYDHSGTYVVTVTDSRGCTTEASIEVKFIDIIIPDVITPGGDGQNDTWSPGNTQNYPNINTDIFDRYGRKVATLRQGQVWDGKYEGNELPTGDYWYLIKLGDADNREFVGHFTIYR
ncbi:T9SS type B sorting domain-containing protein, partial [Flavobacterium sp. NRK1]|uniref:T9SS type B sorting domain-containing protein n=1 Tax=Flavobacterium sp. NRK1 TaxID=2954929 RepID=UPI002092F8AA